MNEAPAHFRVRRARGSAAYRRKLLSIALATIALLVALPASPAKADDTLYKLVNAASGKCLDLENWGYGRYLQQYPCHGQPNQRFKLQADPNANSWEIKPAPYLSSNECLDIEHYGKGPYVQRYKCYLPANQRWTVTTVGVSRDILKFRSHNSPFHCLDASDWGAGVRVQVYQCHGGSNQEWVLTR